ncbi:hypothetical protein BAE44_0018110 [Dichanthelium oligosanthes]|uniref:F-box/LRR-repeat protein 15/At3g58940/PEG3-like LRR domain-containing protein n=1 Tax=Dichanthelium oligosanthes TaxID=888268 RepID=A0A1E5V6X4_9POAL|nr:hypothetical protein BAE44_0018110 [Dichanthelium oligosanthes]
METEAVVPEDKKTRTEEAEEPILILCAHKLSAVVAAIPRLSLPAPAFQFLATLRAFTITKYDILNGEVETLHFPLLKHLGHENVSISEGSLFAAQPECLIADCPVLDCLLLKGSDRFRCLRIVSPSLRASASHQSWNLETLGGLSNLHCYYKFVFGFTVIQKLYIQASILPF